MTEDEKAERRQTIENNEAADCAEVVRREFIAGLLSRKTAPKNAAVFVAHTLTYSDYIVSKGFNKMDLTAQLLGTSGGRDARQSALGQVRREGRHGVTGHHVHRLRKFVDSHELATQERGPPLLLEPVGGVGIC
ncbi:MAG: hypothetical protein Q4P15_13730 [Propionibacteriaceae bacterium]|nr:hypothetical protein [Propionibacteriaceae bacterium]